ncbi:DUF5719 family protein [Bailinhaonella thermotolerans]|uniref:Secreted protein n=1 Tax=Bailinhaonella thermotolerans TaxID=1070861 RepID=A0A3A4AND6_9ACTN|nr:DUF5719 family protein [Bailinhaonella thermotolerans]RJL30481.1 hypothetical protein D5H75_23245 [Bailinhaonella thermotolerans]
MRTFVESRFSLLAMVLVASLALYGVALGSRPDSAAPPVAPPVKAAVHAVSAVCPDPAGARVSVVTPPGRGERGRAVTRVLGRPEPVATVERPGTPWYGEARERAPLSVSADGAMAAGLEAAQTGRAVSGRLRGLSAARCVEPAATSWFVGPGPASAEVLVYLANIDDTRASAEIVAYTGEGPIIGDAGRGLLLAPGEHRVVNLKDVAPMAQVAALEVRTHEGRVAAAVRAVLPGGGVDWLPAAAPPAPRAIVSGVPGGAGRRQLFVAVPGEADALVDVKVVTADGTYALKGREQLEVPAGSAGYLELATGLAGQPASVIVTSEVPVVAGLMSVGTGTRQDVGFTASSPPIDSGSVVADNRSSRGQSSRLVLTAPAAPGRVRVTLLPARGPAPAPSQVEVPAGRTREVRLALPPGGDTGYAVLVEPLPGSGPVYGGRTLEERARTGLMLTIQPLAPARTWTYVPPVADSAAAVTD